MQQLRSSCSVLATHRLEMVDKEMGNATEASRRANFGKLATNDAGPPPRCSCFQRLGEFLENPSNMMEKKPY
jgi:hypothetical protein